MNVEELFIITFSEIFKLLVNVEAFLKSVFPETDKLLVNVEELFIITFPEIFKLLVNVEELLISVLPEIVKVDKIDEAFETTKLLKFVLFCNVVGNDLYCSLKVKTLLFVPKRTLSIKWSSLNTIFTKYPPTASKLPTSPDPKLDLSTLSTIAPKSVTTSENKVAN